MAGMRRQVAAPATAGGALREDRILMAGLVIGREVLIEAPAEVVWRTITEPDQMSQWRAGRFPTRQKPAVSTRPPGHGRPRRPMGPAPGHDQTARRSRARTSKEGRRLARSYPRRDVVDRKSTRLN